MLRVAYITRQGGAVQSGMPRWVQALVGAGAVALGIALFLVAASVALVLLPVILIGGAVGGWFLKRRLERLLRESGLDRSGMGASHPRPDLGRQDFRGDFQGRRPAPASGDIEDAEFRIVREPDGKQS